MFSLDDKNVCLSVVLCRCERVVPLTVLTTDVTLGLTLNVHSEHGMDSADTSDSLKTTVTHAASDCCLSWCRLTVYFVSVYLHCYTFFTIVYIFAEIR